MSNAYDDRAANVAPVGRRAGPMDEEALISRHIEENTHRPGPAYARLKESGVPIWTLIMYWRGAVGGDAARGPMTTTCR